MRKIWGERDARACVKAAKAAGLSLGAWAREHGIDGRSLHAWAVNLGLVTRPAKTPTLIELVPMPSPPKAARYVVRVGDLGIEVADDFSDEALLRIVRALPPTVRVFVAAAPIDMRGSFDALTDREQFGLPVEKLTPAAFKATLV